MSNSDKEDASLSGNESINNNPKFKIKLKSNLTAIPEETRTHCYIKKEIYIPQGNRCCRAHIIKNRIFEKKLALLKVYSNTSSISAFKLSKVKGTPSMRCDSSLFNKVGEYSLSEKQFEVFTRLNWE